MISAMQKAADLARWNKGQSKAAERRRTVTARGKLYSGRPGQVIKMSDRQYAVAENGSFHRLESILETPRKAA